MVKTVAAPPNSQGLFGSRSLRRVTHLPQCHPKLATPSLCGGLLLHLGYVWLVAPSEVKGQPQMHCGWGGFSPLTAWSKAKTIGAIQNMDLSDWESFFQKSGSPATIQCITPQSCEGSRLLAKGKSWGASPLPAARGRKGILTWMVF